MESSEFVHNHYWPGKDLVPISPQASRFGYAFPVYVTRTVWNLSIAWKQGKDTNPDKRIFELLDSCWKGMGKALSSEPDRIMYPFKHWYWERNRPKASKMARSTLAARLFLDPETEEPWMLVFHPQADGLEVVVYGEPKENTQNDGVPADPRVSGVSGDGPEVDLGPEAVRDIGSGQ